MVFVRVSICPMYCFLFLCALIYTHGESFLCLLYIMKRVDLRIKSSQHSGGLFFAIVPKKQNAVAKSTEGVADPHNKRIHSPSMQSYGQKKSSESAHTMPREE
jgi:hypothetical protein